MRCIAVTKKGKRCKRTTLETSFYCHQHEAHAPPHALPVPTLPTTPAPRLPTFATMHLQAESRPETEVPYFPQEFVVEFEDEIPTKGKSKRKPAAKAKRGKITQEVVVTFDSEEDS